MSYFKARCHWMQNSFMSVNYDRRILIACRVHLSGLCDRQRGLSSSSYIDDFRIRSVIITVISHV